MGIYAIFIFSSNRYKNGNRRPVTGEKIQAARCMILDAGGTEQISNTQQGISNGKDNNQITINKIQINTNNQYYKCSSFAPAFGIIPNEL
jgi:hypothetical protein